MLDSHDVDYLYDPDSYYNEQLRKEMEEYWNGEGDYQQSLEDE